MKNLLAKEFRLFILPITYFFLGFALLAFTPGYPILLSAFFVCLGIFQSFRAGNETNDTLYTALLPIPKRAVVKAKFLSVLAMEGIAFVLMALIALFRMSVLADSVVYQQNALMNATPIFLAFLLMIFAAFQFVFLRGFFKTAYRVGAPFVKFGIVTFFLVGFGEALHYFPGCAFFQTPSGEKLGLQWALVAVAVGIFSLISWISYRLSVRSFERIDF